MTSLPASVNRAGPGATLEAGTPDSADLAGLPALWLRDNCPADGGDSGFMDGFHAAAALRAQDPAPFATLGVTPVTFAYRDAAAELLSSPAAMLPVRLGPGDCAVFDNTRVLQARTGFTSGGHRHLQGCHADLDGVESAVAVGERATTGDTRGKDRT